MSPGSRRFLGIIPAREGSKGIPGKNIKNFCGQPLILHTLAAARAAKRLSEVIVSTDSAAIRDVCVEAGGNVPFLRPSELATDDASTKDVVSHALQTYEAQTGQSYDALVLLQPTTPLRTALDIDQAIDIFARSGQTSLISLYQANHCHPSIMYRTVEQGRMVPLLGDDQGKRRQTFNDVFVRNGAVYIVDREYFISQGKMISENCAHLLMPRERSVNIDDLSDWRLAEMYFEQARHGSSR